MSKKVFNSYVNGLESYVKIDHPYQTLLGEFMNDDVSRLSYVIDLTNKYINEYDFDAENLNDLINEVNPKIGTKNSLTQNELLKFIKLFKLDLQ